MKRISIPWLLFIVLLGTAACVPAVFLKLMQRHCPPQAPMGISTRFESTPLKDCDIGALRYFTANPSNEERFLFVESIPGSIHGTGISDVRTALLATIPTKRSTDAVQQDPMITAAYVAGVIAGVGLFLAFYALVVGNNAPTVKLRRGIRHVLTGLFAIAVSLIISAVMLTQDVCFDNATNYKYRLLVDDNAFDVMPHTWIEIPLCRGTHSVRVLDIQSGLQISHEDRIYCRGGGVVGIYNVFSCNSYSLTSSNYQEK